MEVLTVFKCKHDTVFLAINLMDLFFNKTTKKFTKDDLLLIGITSVFMAAKTEEVRPILIKELLGTIKDNAYTK